MLETRPPTHIGEPPCFSAAGDKGIIVKPTDTPLSNLQEERTPAQPDSPF